MEFYIDLVHHIPRFHQAVGHFLVLENLAHFTGRYGVAVYAEDMPSHVAYFVSFFVFGPDLGHHAFPQVPLAGIVNESDEHGLLQLGLIAADDADDGLEGLERLIVHFGVDDRPLYRTGKDAVTVVYGNERYGLPAAHVVSAVDKDGTDHSAVGQRDVRCSFQREYHAAVIDLV